MTNPYEQKNNTEFEEEKGAYNEDAKFNLENKINEVKFGDYITHKIVGALAADTDNYGAFFIAKNPIEVIRVAVTMDDSPTIGPAELDVLICKVGEAHVGAGTTLLNDKFSLTDAFQSQYKDGRDLTNNRILKEGHKISAVLSGTYAGIKGLTITVYYKNINVGYIK